ncbi:cobalamin-binding protein [Thermanaerothrix sp. 4228-RoL]|uniref:Cobalamin-binding protein n=1 Tax=Thermanaerothrix solaris TaxID=3058434 RepID=A0ABU3NR11_9CHLR|nr:cobalamin-binding protein [Thermanaerothrix sp. 4228-RoL]MDT8898810.1 cobalamin-binding protein [Thermanaerothrix sp. 4228-RoL]
MKPLSRFLALTLFLILTLTACVSATPAVTPTMTETRIVLPTVTSAPTVGATSTPAQISATDGLGRVVMLAAPAQRIISLAPSNTEILFALGAAGQVIARDSFSDFPPEVTTVPDIGSTWETLNLEQLVALQPDLVLAAGIQSPEQVKAMEDAGLTVFLVPNPVVLEDLYANLEAVGRLIGREAEATALIESLKARVAAVDAKIATINQKPTVFYELDASQDPAKPWTAGPGSFHDALIARAGGMNIAAKLDSAWAQMSLEQIVAADPDIILLGDAKWGITPESVAQRPGWGSLRAVKEGRVIPFDDDTISRPGPRLVDALENLARILHPEIFK